MINNLIPTCTIWWQLSLQDAVQLERLCVLAAGGEGVGSGCGGYLDLSCVVYDNQPQEDDCRKAYQAFQS